MSGINRNGGRSASGCRFAGEDVLTRDARFSRDPYERGACLSPRTGMQDAPDNSGARPCAPVRSITDAAGIPARSSATPTATAAAPASESSPAPETGVPDAAAAEITKP